MVRGLCKTYRGNPRPALQGVDLNVAKGEIFGVLGPNGAGKTTLISIIATLLVPTQGTVSIFGKDARRDASSLRPLIGLVPQDIALYPSLTIAENMAYFAAMYGLRGADRQKRISECLELVGFETGERKPVAHLSGGMKRRANLAIGILNRPSLLFLDEPTVGIDAHSREIILERILGLRETGMTIIYCTHYMEEAERLCSRVAIVDEGRIVAVGAPRELIAARPECSNLGELYFLLVGKDLRE